MNTLSSQRAITQLSQDLAMARKRRRMTQASLAERAQVSLPTIKRLEAGDDGISLGVLMRVLGVFGLQGQLAAIADAEHDKTGMALLNAALPGKGARVYKRKTPPGEAAPAFERSAL